MCVCVRSQFPCKELDFGVRDFGFAWKILKKYTISWSVTHLISYIMLRPSSYCVRFSSFHFELITRHKLLSTNNDDSSSLLHGIWITNSLWAYNFAKIFPLEQNKMHCDRIEVSRKLFFHFNRTKNERISHVCDVWCLLFCKTKF